MIVGLGERGIIGGASVVIEVRAKVGNATFGDVDHICYLLMMTARQMGPSSSVC